MIGAGTDEVRFRIEKTECSVRTLLGYSTRPLLVAVIITDQPLWRFEQEALMKMADPYLKHYKHFCRKQYGWRRIETEYVFRSVAVDQKQPRPSLYWDCK